MFLIDPVTIRWCKTSQQPLWGRMTLYWGDRAEQHIESRKVTTEVFVGGEVTALSGRISL